MNEQENIDLTLEDVEDIEILDASEPTEYIYVSAEEDQWYADGHSPEDAFIDKFVDTEYFSEEEHLMKKNFIQEVAMKQIEALTHFRAKSVEEDDRELPHPLGVRLPASQKIVSLFLTRAFFSTGVDSGCSSPIHLTKF